MRVGHLKYSFLCRVMDTNPSARFWNKLQYLLNVGYNQDVIDTFKNYCLDEDFDEEAIIDDFDDITDSSISEHLQETYEWKDRKRSDFFSKVREALFRDDDVHEIDDTKEESKVFRYFRCSSQIYLF